MDSSQINEIKQQAIIEKAQDPNSSVSAEAAKETIVSESRKAGAATFSFDPNASASEKAAQIEDSLPADVKNAKNALKGNTSGPAGVSALSDKDLASKPTTKLPPPSTAGAIKAGEVDEKITGPGGWTEEDEKYWKMAGWAPRFGDGVPADLDMNTNLLDHKTWLDERLQDKFFGDWYHNAGVIIFACLASWVVAVLGGGLGWVFLVMAFCGTYYRTSLRRVRRNFRDDVRREMVSSPKPKPS
jgi:Ca2+-dependent lipid-binding protein